MKKKPSPQERGHVAEDNLRINLKVLQPFTRVEKRVVFRDTKGRKNEVDVRQTVWPGTPWQRYVLYEVKKRKK